MLHPAPIYLLLKYIPSCAGCDQDVSHSSSSSDSCEHLAIPVRGGNVRESKLSYCFGPLMNTIKIARPFWSGVGSILLGGSAGGICAYATAGEERRREIHAVAGASYRIANLVGTVGTIVADYTLSMYVFKAGSVSSEYDRLCDQLNQYQTNQEQYTINQWKATDEKEAQQWKDKIVETRELIDRTSSSLAELTSAGGSSSLSPLHTRCAVRLKDLCVMNKGVYIKLGQHLSQLDHILPDEYTYNLRPLLANNPTSSWDSVRRVITEEFGSTPEELWDHIEHEPIACASLAQVHIAWKDGKKYAVKIQHEGLREGSTGDMIAITAIIGTIAKIFPSFSYEWYVDALFFLYSCYSIYCN